MNKQSLVNSTKQGNRKSRYQTSTPVSPPGELVFDSVPVAPLCKNMMSLAKPEVHTCKLTNT